MNTLRVLESEGFTVTYLPLKPNGLIDLEELRSAIREDTLVASIMMINNEIGTIQQMEQIGAILKERGVFFHSDIAQGFGKVPIDVNKFKLDLASVSCHKVGWVHPDLRTERHRRALPAQKAQSEAIA